MNADCLLCNSIFYNINRPVFWNFRGNLNQMEFWNTEFILEFSVFCFSRGKNRSCEPKRKLNQSHRCHFSVFLNKKK